MRLITYTTKNAPHVGTPRKNWARLFVVFRRSGLIHLNLGVTKLLGVQQGARIALHQDAQYPSDWYISLSSGLDGFQATMLKRKGCAIKSDQLVETIRCAIGIGEGNAAPPKSFRISVDPCPKEKGLYTLRTANVKIIE